MAKKLIKSFAVLFVVIYFLANWEIATAQDSDSDPFSGLDPFCFHEKEVKSTIECTNNVICIKQCFEWFKDLHNMHGQCNIKENDTKGTCSCLDCSEKFPSCQEQEVIKRSRECTSFEDCDEECDGLAQTADDDGSIKYYSHCNKRALNIKGTCTCLKCINEPKTCIKVIDKKCIDNKTCETSCWRRLSGRSSECLPLSGETGSDKYCHCFGVAC